jgi:hypothetical protein
MPDLFAEFQGIVILEDHYVSQKMMVRAKQPRYLLII